MKIAITSLKGGVGKTTIATNLAVSFAQKGKSVCIIDTDSEQESSIIWSEQRPDTLAGVTVLRVGEKNLIREVNQHAKNYDVVILDGSPQLSELANATMLASDIVIVPISPSAFDFWSLDKFLGRFRQAQQMKEDLELYILLNKFNEAQNIGKDLSESSLPIFCVSLNLLSKIYNSKSSFICWACLNLLKNLSSDQKSNALGEIGTITMSLANIVAFANSDN